MNINFELYRIFYVVANSGNITKASKELMISQPAVSKTIKNLESQLGGDLFVRTKRGVVLTDEGKEFYNYIKQAIEHINNAENKFTDLINLETGCVKVGVSTTLTKEFLLPFLEIFHNKYPKIDIQINTDVSTNLFPKLRNGLIDLIILNLPTINANDIEIVKCKQVRDCFAVSNKYSELLGRKVTLEEISKYPLILQAEGANTRRFLDKYCDSNNIILNPNMSLSSFGLVVEFTKIGLGIGYVTKDYIKKELENKNLIELDVVPKIPPRHIGLATSKNHIPSFSAKKLIEIIMKQTS